MSRTLAQKRAKHARETIEAIQSKDGDYQADYRSYVNGLPATIVMNGLGQASAMLVSQAQGRGPEDDAHRKLYDDLDEWLRSSTYDSPYGGADDLLEAITDQPESTYTHAQSEALAWLKWAKKFARAYLEERS